MIFGMDDQRMTSPPPVYPLSFLHYLPLLSGVNIWSSCGKTSYKHSQVDTFLSSDAVFRAAHHLWKFSGSFSPPLYEVFRECDG